jgi:hypothetical protein
MPFSRSAAKFAGISESFASNPGLRYAPLDADTRLAWLGDLFPIPILEKVLSIGDLLMVCGVVGLLVSGKARIATSTEGGERVAEQFERR